MPEQWQGFILNFEILVAFVLLWSTAQGLLKKTRLMRRSVALGCVAAVAVLGVMSFPIVIAPGVFYDTRTAVIASAALFGGPVSAAIAGAAAVAYRTYIGGVGMWAGYAGVAMAVAVGLTGRRIVGAAPPTIRILLVLAFVMSMTPMMNAFLFLPTAIHRGTLWMIAPSIVMTFCAALVTMLALRRERLRRELMDNSLLYRAVIEALPDCLNVKDSAGRFIAANPATARLMQATDPGKLIGKTDFDFYPKEIAAGFRADEERVLKEGRIETIEQHVRFRDGSEGWLSTMKVPLRHQDGEFVGLITHNRDVTEQKRLRRELEDTRERLNDAMYNMKDGFAIYDQNCRMVLCNSQYQNLFPRTADIRVPGLLYDDLLRFAVERGEVVLEAGADVETWVIARRKQLFSGYSDVRMIGDGRWILLRTSIVKQGVLFMVTDVTDQRNAENELKAAEREYRALFENSMAGLFRSTPGGRLLRANPAFVKLHGYETEQELLDAVHDITSESYVDPQRRAEFRKLIETDFRVNDFVSEFYRHKTREPIWISVTAWAVFDTDGSVKWYEGSIVDVSERKRAEDVLADVNRKLEQLATTDGLTGLFNRRVFDDTIEKEFARHRRDGRPISIVMIDVDRFKSYNDTYGHLAGDECLRFVSHVFKTVLKRPADIACRYGGEEFVAILPDTDEHGAYEVAEAFRAAVKSLKIAHAGSEFGIVSISAGIATSCEAHPMKDCQALATHADRALYHAKESGRDRVTSAKAA